MSSNRPIEPAHPDDLLEAFALDALDGAEEAAVLEHLESCLQCSQTIDELRQATALLVQSVDTLAPPAELRDRLMRAVEQAGPEIEQLQSAAGQPTARSFADWLFENSFIRVLMPAASAAALVLFVFAVTMNVRVANRVDSLTEENLALRSQMRNDNATMTAKLLQAVGVENKAMDSIQQLQQTSYTLAQPDSQSLLLRPPSQTSGSQGLLLLTREGDRGVLMVAGMNSVQQPTSFHVWLMRGNERTWAGKVDVDDRGWGAVTLQISESIFRFEKVELTDANETGSEIGHNDMVLEATLASANQPPERSVLASWP